jgi:cob(I)alamin adenosyltransferase
MKTYTKTGDDGTTGLFGGERTTKDDARVEAYGTLDELNAAIGVARAAQPSPELDRVLADIQADLFTLGAELATSPEKHPKLGMRLIDDSDVTRLEQAIDACEAMLPPLRAFVLPGGTPTAAALHAARTICRRAERRVVSVGRSVEVRKDAVIYLNRLGDLLFVLARRANHETGTADVAWLPRKG